MKLKDMVELLSNNDACVVLKVKDGQEMNLISLGCFNCWSITPTKSNDLEGACGQPYMTLGMTSRPLSITTI